MSKEKQVYKQINVQTQQEIQFYVFQDLANVLGVLADTQESLKHFKDQPNHPYVPLALNRLTLQINLSNAIMIDQQMTHSVKDDHKKFFESAKEEAKAFFEELVSKYTLDIENEHFSKCVNHYLGKNLAKETQFEQLMGPRYQQTSDFNQKTVQQIFNGMQEVNDTMNQIADGKYEKLTKEVILEQTLARAKRARLMLNQNFPQQGDAPQIQQPQEVPQEVQVPQEQPQQIHQENPPKQGDEEGTDVPEDQEKANIPQESKEPLLKEQLNESEKKQEKPKPDMELEKQPEEAQKPSEPAGKMEEEQQPVQSE